jgi:hypothetical protein
MSNTTSHDEFDLISLVSDLTEVTDSPETGLIRQRSASSVASTAEPQRKKKRSNDLLWEHTRPPKEGEDARNKHKQEIYYCKHCTSYAGTPASVRFREHLITHQIRIAATAESASRIAFNNTIKDIFGKQLEKQAGHNIDQEKHLCIAIQEAEFKEACVRLITVRNLPHSLLDWAEFWAVILSVNYMAKETLKIARKDVPQLIKSTYILHQEQLIQKLQKSLSWIHFSIDMWTAPQKTGFQAIVVHWADADTRHVECALLSLKEFKGSHSGEEQARVFIEVIKEAGLQGKLGCFTMDNATSNDKMLHYIANEIKNFDPILRRVRCFGHIINLVIQAFLFGAKNRGGEDLMDQEEAINLAIQEIGLLAKEANRDIHNKVELASEWRKLGSLGKLHNINIWVRASTERYQNFIKAIGRAIPLGNNTRWNSWSTEVDVALTKRRELRDWIEEHWDELGEDTLDRDDWQELEDIKEFLQPFVDCTLNTQGITDSLDTTFTAMEFFVKHFNEMKNKHKDNPQINARVLTAWFKFDRYYKLTDETAIYVASVLLHPELRKQYLEKVWAHQSQYIKPAINATRKLWTEYFKLASPSTHAQDLDAIRDPIQRWRAEMTRSSAIIEEFDDFIKGTTIPIGTQQTALEWWLEPVRHTVYPNLTQMAITIFTIAPMSAGPERVFSGAKHTIAPERVRLGAAMVEMTECLKSWVRISPGRQQAPLSGVFRDSRSLTEAVEYLEKALKVTEDEEHASL